MHEYIINVEVIRDYDLIQPTEVSLVTKNTKNGLCVTRECADERRGSLRLEGAREWERKKI